MRKFKIGDRVDIKSKELAGYFKNPTKNVLIRGIDGEYSTKKQCLILEDGPEVWFAKPSEVRLSKSSTPEQDSEYEEVELKTDELIKFLNTFDKNYYHTLKVKPLSMTIDLKMSGIGDFYKGTGRLIGLDIAKGCKN